MLARAPPEFLSFLEQSASSVPLPSSGKSKHKSKLKTKLKSLKTAPTPAPTPAYSISSPLRAGRDSSSVSLAASEGLRDLLTAARSQLSAASQRDLEETVATQILQYRRVLTDVPAGELRAMLLHEGLDTLLAEEAPKKEGGPEGQTPVSCQRGCASCCRRQVDVTPSEATLLLSRLRTQHGRVPPEMRLRWERQAQFASWQALDFWRSGEATQRYPLPPPAPLTPHLGVPS